MLQSLLFLLFVHRGNAIVNQQKGFYSVQDGELLVRHPVLRVDYDAEHKSLQFVVDEN